MSPTTFWRLGLLLGIAGICLGDIPCKDSNVNDVDFGEGDTSCHLTSQSFYSYVVRVWNTVALNTSAHGTILSYTSVLTTCAPFVHKEGARTITNTVDNLLVFGQKVRNVTSSDWTVEGPNICFQTRKVTSIVPHPKCDLQRAWDLYFNFAILTIDRPFLVFRQHSYPAVQLPNTLYVAVYYVVLVNVVKDSRCEIPLWYYHAHQKPTFASDMRVSSLRFLSECIERICEQEPLVHNSSFRYPGQWPAPMKHMTAEEKTAEWNRVVKVCMKTFKSLQNYTMLCVYFPGEPLLKVGYQFFDIRSQLWTGGAPLVCNGTTIGITSSAKERSTFHSYRHDFYIINTVVRVWPWLMAQRPKYGQNWLKDFVIERDMKDRAEPPRDDEAKPVIDPNEFRSWTDDDDNSGSRSSKRLLISIGSFLSAISIIVISLIAYFT